MLSRFKVCKYETGIFVQKIYVYCMKMIKNILFEVLLIALPIYIFPTCLAIGGCHAKKTVALLRQTSHRAIFVHFRKKWSAGADISPVPVLLDALYIICIFRDMFSTQDYNFSSKNFQVATHVCSIYEIASFRFKSKSLFLYLWTLLRVT